MSNNDQNNPYLSIVVPLYNEEESVEELHSSIIKVAENFNFSHEIIFVDDGSTDNTWEIIERLKAENPSLIGIKFRRNYGQTNAMAAGFEYSSGKIIVTLDGDLQNDPADIPLLIKKIDEGYDIVSGWRKNRKDHSLRVIPSKVANAIISFTTKVRLHDFGCSLKAYRAECVKSIKVYGDMHRFFPAIASMTGARIAEIEVNHKSRKYGVSKYGFDRILKVLSDIFSMSLIIRFSSYPLKGFVLCAVPFVILTMFFIVMGFLAILYEWTAGKFLFFLVCSFLNGMAVIHLITLGVLAELAVDTSDLTHTELPEITKKRLFLNDSGEISNEIDYVKINEENPSKVSLNNQDRKD